MTRYAVLGPGGVGGLLAAVLADRGHEVVVVARVESVNVLQDNGIRVNSGIFGDLVARPRVVAVLDRSVDVVLVAAKATALEPALRGIPAEVVGDALVVPFLNGLDHMDVLRRRYPSVAAACDPRRVVAAGGWGDRALESLCAGSSRDGRTAAGRSGGCRGAGSR